MYDELIQRTEQLLHELKAINTPPETQEVSCPIPLMWGKGSYNKRTGVLRVDAPVEMVDLRTLRTFLHRLYNIKPEKIIFRED